MYQQVYFEDIVILIWKFISCSIKLFPEYLPRHVEKLDLVIGMWMVVAPHGECVLFRQPVVECVEEAEAWCEKPND